ncbi:MAG: hypothetical protein A2921_01305 [Candidatus Magasanikbacteria bacterium RIFCSPLOWO2_01_FULL_43_20b]|uniref:Uncharacterized protein n=1 Tax=Candidatus Magasanikbacteria bacterium RIFCSPLOWO2_12_FULL_43_12 TaxID=1798692 RepID=A0A1F6MS37_9BACT|nr:MAG: hypothetical protein A3C74_03145 [Candidatus Magasanikbacteria bacterium RIFCSPHIGHO2_02_FULL_44_13]OGH72538.1 MAG: hypothetical protein A3I93_03800 [Candidatus Magasanikbacteria bacterium RIFCSPLOWO2_02_FULL_43_22]OGH73548.1 MAG: hypothetical protein A2921_01305 [Candidatus Magasanikbacteria bacterium RIFCSPLOWO2_01_FULL_43_20b]OGH74243.1 MAG: hypothetical protein A3G00_02740 [Candidatus Magasanikbacteria bacterium RIFCSPLOWO2_12_FULL_43_12]
MHAEHFIKPPSAADKQKIDTQGGGNGEYNKQGIIFLKPKLHSVNYQFSIFIIFKKIFKSKILNFF